MIRPQTCGVCGKELDVGNAAAAALFPFCSQRCRDVDLYRWCTGRYAIVEPVDEERLLEEEWQGDDPPERPM